MSIIRHATLPPRVPATAIGGTDPRFARDSRGRIYLADDLAPGQVFEFDSLGAFVRAFGRLGSGPGEYQIIKHLWIDRGDSLHVFDDATRRHTVLDPARKVARMSRYPGSNRGLIVLPDDRVIVSRSLPTPDRAGLPLHISNDTGDIARSFGSPTGFWRSDFPQSLLRSICTARSDGLWAAYFTRYRLEYWTTDGMLRESLSRPAPWFTPWVKPDGRIGEAPPQPRITSIACESSGRIWVTALVPDSQWTQGLGERKGERGKAITVVDPNRYYDTIVEVIEPESRRVLGSRRVDEALYELFAPGYAWAVRVNVKNNARRQFEIWRVRFLQE